MSKIGGRTGERRIMNNGLLAEIVTYRGYCDIDVQFVATGQIVTNRRCDKFKQGAISCPLLVEHVEDYARVTNPNTGASWLMDMDDLPLLGDYLWCADGNGYIMHGSRAGAVYLHRLVSHASGGAECDHISGDKANVRKCNLRLCTKSQNGCNRGANKNNTSGYKGICWDKRSRKWLSQIHLAGNRIYLGLFDDKIAAAEAYNEAALKYHGEFARVNEMRV